MFSFPFQPPLSWSRTPEKSGAGSRRKTEQTEGGRDISLAGGGDAGTESPLGPDLASGCSSPIGTF